MRHPDRPVASTKILQEMHRPSEQCTSKPSDLIDGRTEITLPESEGTPSLSTAALKHEIELPAIDQEMAGQMHSHRRAAVLVGVPSSLERSDRNSDVAQRSTGNRTSLQQLDGMHVDCLQIQHQLINLVRGDEDDALATRP